MEDTVQNHWHELDEPLTLALDLTKVHIRDINSTAIAAELLGYLRATCRHFRDTESPRASVSSL